MENRPSGAFFVGEIVNPTDQYVVLYKNEVAIDPARLDDQNMFVISLDQVEEGLYHFNHSPELQYIYLEKGDSLLMRLNTSDFDESLIFSGKGEEINNFLLEIFLKDEEEEPLVYSYYDLEPDDFQYKIDSLKGVKTQLLDDLLSELNLSDKAMEIALASIEYNSYIYKEKYPFYHKRKTGKQTLHELKNGFYDYRKQVNYNNANLTYFRPYYNFMKYHFGNMAYMTCTHNCIKEDELVKNKLHYNQHKLALIDSLVVEKNLRDNLFRNVAVDYFLKSHDNVENNKIFIDQFLELSENNQHIEEITALYDGINNLQPNHKLPNLTLQAVNGSKVSLDELAQNRKAVFYFWSASQPKHLDKVSDYVKELTNKHPEYSFIGVNWNTDPKKWESLIEAKGLDKELQYRTVDFNKLAKTLVFDDFNKAIITNDGVIVNGFANLYTSF